jgi:NDP-sugar pyrophosphorylase family protein
MLNIVIPMAGRGSRFVKAGYQHPKPFIDVLGTPMIQRVVENLTPLESYRFIFLARREHEAYIKRHMSFATDVIYVDEVTEGAACTVLLAKELINTSGGLVIANSDQLVTWSERKLQTGGGYSWLESNNIQDMINECKIHEHDSMIATFYSNHPKWSYARLDGNDEVVEVAEKKVISEHATVGVYYYKNGYEFVASAKEMIRKNIRVNNEFYVCPVFNEMILRGKQIGIYPVRDMDGLGTPEDLEVFEEIYNGTKGWEK